MLTAPDEPTEDTSDARPLAVDLFAGAGGLSLGFEQAGFDVVAAVEYDPVHAATHAFNFARSEVLCRDISLIDGDIVLAAASRGFKRLYPERPWKGELDALIGGPPCQGFSSGGKREVGDERNSLLLHFVRLVEEIRPKTFCLENVAGLLEVRYGYIRKEAFRRLEAAGYGISGTDSLLNSVDFGVPQSRRRVVVLGARGVDAPISPQPVDGKLTVGDAFEGLCSPMQFEELFHSDKVYLGDSAVALRARSVGKYARGLAGLEPITDRSRPRIWDPCLLTGSRLTKHTRQTIERFADTTPGKVEPISRLYRLPLDGPSRTLRAGTGSERGAHTSPRPIHPTEDRVITVREAARLHGYPDWFRFHTTNWHGHRQVGNSVPPPLARAAALSLIESLGVSPKAVNAFEPLGDADLLELSRGCANPIVGALVDHLPKTRARKHLPDAAG
jgi:DNA (cytosine-5)-methyltransferase 1